MSAIPFGMKLDDIVFLSASELAHYYRSGELSPVEALEAVIAQVDRVNPTLNAIVSTDLEVARAAARDAEAAFRAKSDQAATHNPMLGVPCSIKDVIPVRGLPNTAGSALFREVIAREDGPLVAALRQAGGVIFGKTNTPELGWKGATDNLVYGVTRNPWNLQRTPGGSSGGAAAAVAAGMGPLAVGTDGAGSIRIPASFCGVVGLKPTYGLVPYAPPSAVEMLAHAGPLSRTVRDAALLLDAVATFHSADRNCVPGPTRCYLEACDAPLPANLRIGVSTDLGIVGVDPSVRSIFERAVRALNTAVAVAPAEVHTPDPEDAVQLFFAAGIGGRLAAHGPDWRERVDPGLRRFVEAYESRTAWDFAQAITVRAQITEAFRQLFEQIDILVTPTLPVTAFELGLDYPASVGNVVRPNLAWTPLTYVFNLTGQPAISVPAGWTPEGLPVGLQIVGRRFEDDLVLRVAAVFEGVAPWKHRRPSVA